MQSLPKITILMSAVIFGSGCQTSESDQSKEPVRAESTPTPIPDAPAGETVHEPPKPKPPTVVINDDLAVAVDRSQGCANGYFMWLPWKNLPTKDDVLLKPKGSISFSDQFQVSYKLDGDPLRASTHTIAERIFEEELVLAGYTYPFQSMKFFGTKETYQSRLQFSFDNTSFDHSWILSLGQLFRYTPDALTRIRISSPQVSDWNDSYEVIQTAAAYRSTDFDGELRIEAEKDYLEIYQDGASGTNSGFMILRPKPGIAIKQLNLEINAAAWRGARADTIELAFAKLFCGSKRCQHAEKVMYYDAGLIKDAKVKAQQDPVLALGKAQSGPNSHDVMIGAKGSLSLALDGVALNQSDTDLILIPATKENGQSCGFDRNLRAYGRFQVDEPWVLLKEGWQRCDEVSLDLQEQARIQYLKIEHQSNDGRSPAYRLNGVVCSPPYSDE